MNDDLTDPPLTEKTNLVELRRAALITAAMGVAHAILEIVAYLVIRANSPAPGAPDAEFLAFASDESRVRMVLIAGIYLLPFAGIAFIWFTVSLRMWVHGSSDRLTPLLANILLVCGIIYVALLFVAGAAMSVLAMTAQFGDSNENLTLFRQFPRFGVTLLLVFAMRMAAMIVFTISNIGRTHGILPRWFSYSGFIIGLVLLLTANLSPVVILVFPCWLLCFSIILVRKAAKLPGGRSG